MSSYTLTLPSDQLAVISWQGESYDHVVRDRGELQRTVTYVMIHPVKAGLVQHEIEWKWTDSKYE